MGDNAQAERLIRAHVTLRAEQVRDVMAVLDFQRQHFDSTTTPGDKK